MIVKNEEQTLPRILNCAKKFADEIIIVDTGSNYNTKQIAKAFTDKVYDFKWVDDFSKARNFAFSKATCDYQMWLDADDFVDDKNIQKILDLKKNNDFADVFMFKYVFSNLTYFRERLLKRNKNFKWEGFVHEAIAPCGKIEYCDIEIIHKKEKFGDPKRNLNLYRKAIKRGVKLNARELYYYSRELYYNGYYSKAISSLKRYLALPYTFLPDNLGANLLLAECYQIKGEKHKSLSILLNALKLHNPNAELCCKIGYAFENIQQNEKAVFWFKSALICDKQTSGFVEKAYEDIIPLLELTKLCYTLSRFDDAKYYHSQAKAIAPSHPSVIYNDQFFKMPH